MTRIEFLIEKERVMAKWKLLEEIVNLNYYGCMDYQKAVQYKLEEVGDKIEELRSFEERYGKKIR